MALKDRSKKTETKETKSDVTFNVTVLKAREVGSKNDIVFDLEVNGVKIYGCWIKTSKDGETFTSFPSYKGTNDKWYSHAYFEIAADVQKDIEDQIEKLLDENNK